jgi:hypothetical protein
MTQSAKKSTGTIENYLCPMSGPEAHTVIVTGNSTTLTTRPRLW